MITEERLLEERLLKLLSYKEKIFFDILINLLSQFNECGKTECMLFFMKLDKLMTKNKLKIK